MTSEPLRTVTPEAFANLIVANMKLASIVVRQINERNALINTITIGSRWRAKTGDHLIEVIDYSEGGFLVSSVLRDGHPLKRPHKHLTAADIRERFEPDMPGDDAWSDEVFDRAEIRHGDRVVREAKGTLTKPY